MEKRYDEDRKLYQKKKPANKKLTYLPILSQKLKNVLFSLNQLMVWDKFLESNGLQQFQLWFTKLPEGIEPSLTLRKGLLEILNNLRIRSEHLSRTNQIQRTVQKHKKSQSWHCSRKKFRKSYCSEFAKTSMSTKFFTRTMGIFHTIIDQKTQRLRKLRHFHWEASNQTEDLLKSVYRQT